jgi:hypothetical protein
MLRFPIALLALACAASFARAQDAPPPPLDKLACDGPFARDSSHTKLIAAFGPKNVSFEDVDAAEGKKEKATVLFANEPTRRVEIFWSDGAKRARPSAIRIRTPSQWVGPLGITAGLMATKVEKINGKAFSINGFGWDNGGYAGRFEGKLATLPGGCRLSLRFEASIANPLPARYAPIIGDKKILSSNALMRRAKPMISEWNVGYGE